MQKHITRFSQVNENIDFTLAAKDISINTYAMISKFSEHII